MNSPFPLSLPIRIAIGSALIANSAFCQSKEATFACKYVGEGNEIRILSGSLNALVVASNPSGNRILFGGNVELPTSKRYQGVSWKACAGLDGQLLWAVRSSEQPEAASLFPLATDGDWIWTGGMLKNGIFRLAKFEARTLRREASLQMAFEPTAPAPYIHFHSGTEQDSDLRVSVVQTLGGSFRVAIFSRDPKLVLDRVYSIPLASDRAKSEASAGGSLARLPDHSGYYLFLTKVLASEDKTRSRIAILRLDNNGAVKWANTYLLHFPDPEVDPRVTPDGSILIAPMCPTTPNRALMKIRPDGNVNWSIWFDELTPNLNDFQGSSTPYRFTEPWLLTNSTQLGSRGLVYCVVSKIDYQTGKIENQIKFGANTPGVGGFLEKRADSFYLGFMNSTLSLHPVCHCALLRLDYDLNLLAARKVLNGHPSWPSFRLLPSGGGLVSYDYPEKRTLVAEMVDETLESANACQFLDKDTFALTKTHFGAHPADVTVSPLTPITVSEPKSKVTPGGEIALVPLGLKSISCNGKADIGNRAGVHP